MGGRASDVLFALEDAISYIRDLIEESEVDQISLIREEIQENSIRGVY